MPLRFSNNKEGIKLLGKRLAAAKPALAVIEATGKLHRLALRMLGAPGYPAAAVDRF